MDSPAAEMCIRDSRYAGPTGAIIAMHGFGASAPIKDVMPHFGFTADHVCEAARAQMGRGSTT